MRTVVTAILFVCTCITAKAQETNIYSHTSKVNRLICSYYYWRVPEITHGKSETIVITDSVVNDLIYITIDVLDSSLLQGKIYANKVNVKIIGNNRTGNYLRITLTKKKKRKTHLIGSSIKMAIHYQSEGVLLYVNKKPFFLIELSKE